MAELFATSKQTISNCLIIISPISPFSNMLNTWWLCVILQYHSISHAFCRHTINGIPFHYLDVWYAVILISHYFSLGIRLLYKLGYCDNDSIKTTYLRHNWDFLIFGCKGTTFFWTMQIYLQKCTQIVIFIRVSLFICCFLLLQLDWKDETIADVTELLARGVM